MSVCNIVKKTASRKRIQRGYLSAVQGLETDTRAVFFSLWHQNAPRAFFYCLYTPCSLHSSNIRSYRLKGMPVYTQLEVEKI